MACVDKNVMHAVRTIKNSWKYKYQFRSLFKNVRKVKRFKSVGTFYHSAHKLHIAQEWYLYLQKNIA